MTDGEICAMYRQAKDKKAQIKILVDLAQRPRDSIRETLRANGYIVPDRIDNTPASQARKAAKLQELLNQKKSRAEIAEAFGVQLSTVNHWLRTPRKKAGHS